MPTPILPPVITVGAVGRGYLGASFSWGQAVEDALHHVIIDGGGERPATLSDFDFFDSTGHRVRVLDERLMTVRIESQDLQVWLRRRIGQIMRDIELAYPLPRPFEAMLDLPYEPTSFECFALKLAVALQDPTDVGSVDPNRGGWGHRAAHFLGVAHRR